MIPSAEISVIGQKPIEQTDEVSVAPDACPIVKSAFFEIPMPSPRAGQGTVGIAVDFSSEQGKLVRVAVHGVRAGAAGQKIAVAPQHADIGP